MIQDPPVPIDISLVFIELGTAIIGLALLARLANRWAFSAIPLIYTITTRTARKG